MFFNFNGTAVYVYGGMRSNHGNYSSKLDHHYHCSYRLLIGRHLAQVDGGDISTQDGYSAQDKFQAPILSATGLSMDTEHSVVRPARQERITMRVDQWRGLCAVLLIRESQI